MDIELLKQYKDACMLCMDIDDQIKQLNEKQDEVVADCVTGSSNQYPYTTRKYTIQGVACSQSCKESLNRKMMILLERKAAAEKIKTEVEAFMNETPIRMQRIIRYKIIDGLPWEKVADRMGGRSTGESLRKEFKRYLKK